MLLNITDSKFQFSGKETLQPAYNPWWIWGSESTSADGDFWPQWDHYSLSVTRWLFEERCLVVPFKIRLFFLRGTCWFRGFLISNFYFNPRFVCFLSGFRWLLLSSARDSQFLLGKNLNSSNLMLRFPAYLTTIIASSIHISLAVLAWFPPHGWLRFGNLALFAGHENESLECY